eukprot:6195276-Pleurochrysis_carterae.AAC.1
MQLPASARGVQPPPTVRPQAALCPPPSILASYVKSRGMVGGENIAPARPPAGSVIVRARWQEC